METFEAYVGILSSPISSRELDGFSFCWGFLRLARATRNSLHKPIHSGVMASPLIRKGILCNIIRQPCAARRDSKLHRLGA